LATASVIAVRRDALIADGVVSNGIDCAELGVLDPP
jgi:hypothetical protein